MSQTLRRLANKGYAVFVYDRSTQDVEKMFALVKFASWLGWTGFLELRGIRKDTRGFFVVEDCLASALIKAIFKEVMAVRQVKVAA